MIFDSALADRRQGNEAFLHHMMDKAKLRDEFDLAVFLDYLLTGSVPTREHERRYKTLLHTKRRR